MLRTLKSFPSLYAPDPTFNRNPDLFPTLTRDENRAFPTVEEHLSRYIKLVSLNRWALTYMQFLGTLTIPTSRTTTFETSSGGRDLSRPSHTMVTKREMISSDLRLRPLGSPRSLLATKMETTSSTLRKR